jgi:hypothetical protein
MGLSGCKHQNTACFTFTAAQGNEIRPYAVNTPHSGTFVSDGVVGRNGRKTWTGSAIA